MNVALLSLVTTMITPAGSRWLTKQYNDAFRLDRTSSDVFTSIVLLQGGLWSGSTITMYIIELSGAVCCSPSTKPRASSSYLLLTTVLLATNVLNVLVCTVLIRGYQRCSHAVPLDEERRPEQDQQREEGSYVAVVV
jgi:hypothetical protein